MFNKHNLKLSYAALPNMGSVISSHNRKIIKKFLSSQVPKIPTCNCRGGTVRCPLQGACLVKNIIYEARVTSESGTKVYTGQTSTDFKTRYNNHQSSFNLPHKESTTTLSAYIWYLKRKDESYKITWSKIKSAQPYSPESGRCQLCTAEATAISRMDRNTSLNLR